MSKSVHNGIHIPSYRCANRPIEFVSNARFMRIDCVRNSNEQKTDRMRIEPIHTWRYRILSKNRHFQVRHLQQTSPNVFSLLTNFRFSNIRHNTLIIRQTGYVFQYFITLLLILVYPLVRRRASRSSWLVQMYSVSTSSPFVKYAVFVSTPFQLVSVS